MVWTAFLAHGLGVTLPLRVPFTLGLAVWYLYAGDRISDAAWGRASEERHTFHHNYRRFFISVAVAATPLMLALIEHLPSAVRAGWLLLSFPLMAYLLAVHVLNLRLTKEPLVAVFFATAVGLPVLIQAGGISGLAKGAVVVFGFLCWLNCVAVARWERSLQTADRLTAWLARHFQLAATLSICSAMPLLTTLQTAPLAWAIVAAAICLLLLDASRDHLEATTLRALADASLLTPFAVWPIEKLLTAR